MTHYDRGLVVKALLLGFRVEWNQKAEGWGVRFPAGTYSFVTYVSEDHAWRDVVEYYLPMLYTPSELPEL